jgi:hypothetical protein
MCRWLVAVGVYAAAIHIENTQAWGKRYYWYAIDAASSERHPSGHHVAAPFESQKLVDNAHIGNGHLAGGTSSNRNSDNGRRDFSIKLKAKRGQAEEKQTIRNRRKEAEARWMAIKNSKAPDHFEEFLENLSAIPHRKEARDRPNELKLATAIDEMTWQIFGPEKDV